MPQKTRVEQGVYKLACTTSQGSAGCRVKQEMHSKCSSHRAGQKGLKSTISGKAISALAKQAQVCITVCRRSWSVTWVKLEIQEGMQSTRITQTLDPDV